MSRFTPFQLLSLYRMLKDYGFSFYRLGHHLSSVVAFAETIEAMAESKIIIPGLENESLGSEKLSELRRLLNDSREDCEACGLDLSVIAIDEILAKSDEDFRLGKNHYLFGILVDRVRDELCRVSFIPIPKSRVRYFEAEKPFGEQVAKAFPSAGFDVEEASKCFGLERYTACVMHLMRVIEVGLKALADAVGADKTVPSWDGILNKIAVELPKYYKQSPWSTAEAEFYADAARHIQTYIKARNRTQHADKKYTEEEARRIYEAVCELMQHLATKLSEPPKAEVLV